MSQKMQEQKNNIKDEHIIIINTKEINKKPGYQKIKTN